MRVSIVERRLPQRTGRQTLRLKTSVGTFTVMNGRYTGIESLVRIRWSVSSFLLVEAWGAGTGADRYTAQMLKSLLASFPFMPRLFPQYSQNTTVRLPKDIVTIAKVLRLRQKTRRWEWKQKSTTLDHCALTFPIAFCPVICLESNSQILYTDCQYCKGREGNHKHKHNVNKNSRISHHWALSNNFYVLWSDHIQELLVRDFFSISMILRISKSTKYNENTVYWAQKHSLSYLSKSLIYLHTTIFLHYTLKWKIYRAFPSHKRQGHLQI